MFQFSLTPAEGDRAAPASHLSQKRKCQCGHESQGEDERAAKRKHHRNCHRMKHFPFDASEREDRHINDRDNQHSEKDRLAHLFAGRKHGLELLFFGQLASKSLLLFGQFAHDIFHNDDCAIND